MLGSNRDKPQRRLSAICNTRHELTAVPSSGTLAGSYHTFRLTCPSHPTGDDTSEQKVGKIHEQTILDVKRVMIHFIWPIHFRRQLPAIRDHWRKNKNDIENRRSACPGNENQPVSTRHCIRNNERCFKKYFNSSPSI